jgi:hypothetical protein
LWPPYIQCPAARSTGLILQDQSIVRRFPASPPFGSMIQKHLLTLHLLTLHLLTLHKKAA